MQELIIQSRNDAISAGVLPIPSAIRQNLAGFIPEHLLNVVRYRVRGGGDLTLQANAIRYGEASAIALDYVVVFADNNDALYNPTLWSHELKHVDQYQRWGIRDFAIRYLRSYNSVEKEAYEEETKYLAWVGITNSQQWASMGNQINVVALNKPVSPFSVNQNTNTCGTAVMSCQLNEFAPVGTPCWCNTTNGAATGSLIPNAASINSSICGTASLVCQLDVSAPIGTPCWCNTPSGAVTGSLINSGLPSGYGMQVCGCWGPNPVQIANEPRCISGHVRINLCQGLCAPGHPLYAYVCQ